MHGSFLSLLDADPGSYFVLLVAGFAVATAIAALSVRRQGQNPDFIIDLSLAALIAGVVGARLLHVIADGYFWDYVHLCTDPAQVEWQISKYECLRQGDLWNAAKSVCQPAFDDSVGDVINRCTTWAQFWAGGLTYYGGLIAATAVAVWLCRRDNFSLGKAADAAAMGMAVGLGFGRMGCLLAGCCFGRTTELPWSLTFPPYSAASSSQAKLGLIDGREFASLAVHPTQIYESAGCFAIAAFLMLWLAGRKRYDGHVFLGFLGLYAVLRFLLEFWRADDRGGLVGLSTSQLIGLGLIAAILAFHVARRRRLASG
jgi:phosphatidylglycerol---prolipoprotein diacylglyceryl transferase